MKALVVAYMNAAGRSTVPVVPTIFVTIRRLYVDDDGWLKIKSMHDHSMRLCIVPYDQ